MKKTTTVAATSVTGSKTPAPSTQTKQFNLASYVKPGVTEADLITYKTAFDLFDTDQGGSIDTNCTPSA